jgi:hypothetical protein
MRKEICRKERNEIQTLGRKEKKEQAVNVMLDAFTNRCRNRTHTVCSLCGPGVLEHSLGLPA